MKITENEITDFVENYLKEKNVNDEIMVSSTDQNSKKYWTINIATNKDGLRPANYIMLQFNLLKERKIDYKTFVKKKIDEFIKLHYNK